MRLLWISAVGAVPFSHTNSIQSVQILYWKGFFMFLSGRRSTSPLRAPLSGASHPSLAAISLPSKWTLLWLPGWRASHLWQALKIWHPTTGSHNPDTIVMGTLEIYEYLKVAVILFFSLYPLCLEKTQGKWMKAFGNTRSNSFPSWNTLTVACLLFSGCRVGVVFFFFFPESTEHPSFQSGFFEGFSNWLSRHTNHFLSI